MKKYRLILLSASIIAALASCAKEQVVETDGKSADKLTIEAFFADDMATKNCIDDAGTIYWTPNDSISVFFGDYSFPFYSYNSKPVTRANFIGSAWIATGSNAESDETTDEYNYWGVYPLRTNDFRYRTVKNGEGVMCFVDENQTAVDGTFDRSTFVTVACSHDYTKLAFYNLCGGVRFKVTSSDIDMVTFSGNNGEALGGEVLVKMDAEGHPYPAEHYSDIKTIRLQAPSGTTFKPGVWYYIVTLPTELSNGFTMKFISKKNNRMAVLKKESKVSIARSRFGNLSNPESGLEYKAYDGSEDKRQLENGIFLKSVKMTDEGHFDLELGYPSVEIQRLFEKYKLRIHIQSEDAMQVSDDMFILDPYIESESGEDFYYSFDTSLKMTYEDERLLNYYLEKFESDCEAVYFNSSNGKFVGTSDYNNKYIGADSKYYYFAQSHYDSLLDKNYDIVARVDRNTFSIEQYGSFGDIRVCNRAYNYFLMLDGKYPAVLGPSIYGYDDMVLACFMSKDNLKYTVQGNCEFCFPGEEYAIINAGTAYYFIDATYSYDPYVQWATEKSIYYLTAKNGAPQIIKKSDIVQCEEFTNTGNNHIITYSKEKTAVIINGGFSYKLSEDGTVTEKTIPDEHLTFTDYYSSPYSIDILFSPDYKTCYYSGRFQDYPSSDHYIELCVKNLITDQKIRSCVYDGDMKYIINDYESGYYGGHLCTIIHGFDMTHSYDSHVIDYDSNKIYTAKDGYEGPSGDVHVDTPAPKYDFYIKQ